MEEFSSRRQSISALTVRLAREFEAQHGHAPDARAWASCASGPTTPAGAAKDA